jgi:formylglycine-generating enzyme required for sulfatase activity
LIDLICTANPEEHAIFFPLVEKQPRTQVIEYLDGVAKTLPPEVLGSVPRISHGKRRANAAATMLRLGERDRVTPVFNWINDPEALTQFMFSCRPRGIPAATLIDLVELVSDGPPSRFPEDARYALLLSVGEYGRAEIPEGRRKKLVDQLSDWYANDPSSGVHGASGWLLRHLGEEGVVNAIDQRSIPYSPSREWFTIAVSVQPKSIKGPVENPISVEPIKTFYYTFVVFPKGEYSIGSPEDEVDRYKDEKLHEIELTRSFAILDREITFEELIAFRPDQYNQLAREFGSSPTGAGSGVDWYDSVSFARWLGSELGLLEVQQCYADPKSLGMDKFVPDPNVTWAPWNWPSDLGKAGFRLPTESEWEAAARSGSRTAYGFGSEPQLLRRFDWFTENSEARVHSPKELRPGVRGLFDIHGNVIEWTNDWDGSYSSAERIDPVGNKSGSSRIFRGGSWNYPPSFCRSAFRDWRPPSDRLNYGFRLALSSSGFDVLTD